MYGVTACLASKPRMKAAFSAFFALLWRCAKVADTLQCSSFYIGVQVLNSGPHTCMPNTLLSHLLSPYILFMLVSKNVLYFCTDRCIKGHSLESVLFLDPRLASLWIADVSSFIFRERLLSFSSLQFLPVGSCCTHSSDSPLLTWCF